MHCFSQQCIIKLRLLEFLCEFKSYSADIAMNALDEFRYVIRKQVRSRYGLKFGCVHCVHRTQGLFARSITQHRQYTFLINQLINELPPIN